MGYVRVRKSNMGLSSLNCLDENMIRDMIPIIRVLMTTGLPQPLRLPTLKPYTMPPKPIVDNKIESTSILGFVKVVTFCTKSNPYTNEKSKNGMSNQRIQFQLKTSMINPAVAGPIAGADIITSPTNPIMVPLL